MEMHVIDTAADALVALYDADFGGKASGRYRISRKLVGELLGRQRIYPEEIQRLARVLFEKGYVLIDMDTFFVVLGANTFVNYRRANAECIPVPSDTRRSRLGGHGSG